MDEKLNNVKVYCLLFQPLNSAILSSIFITIVILLTDVRNLPENNIIVKMMYSMWILSIPFMDLKTFDFLYEDGGGDSEYGTYFSYLIFNWVYWLIVNLWTIVVNQGLVHFLTGLKLLISYIILLIVLFIAFVITRDIRNTYFKQFHQLTIEKKRKEIN